MGDNTSNGNGGAGGNGSTPATGGWRLGNGSLMVMPGFQNMPAGSIGYADLAAQMMDAQRMIDSGPGRFNGNTAGRYAFAGGNYGSDNPLAYAGQGLLGFGQAAYNPFAGRGNGGGGLLGGGTGGGTGGGNVSPPGTLPGFPAAGSPGSPGGPRDPSATPRDPNRTPGTGIIMPGLPELGGIRDPSATSTRTTGNNGTTTPAAYPGYGTPPQGVTWPGYEANFGQAPAALNTPANAQLAMAGNGAGLLAATGGNQAQANQLTNAYNVGGTNYRPWLNALAGQGLTAPTAGAMATQWASEGLGQMVNGQWQWAPGMGWETATNSVY